MQIKVHQIDIHKTRKKIESETINIIDIRDPGSYAMSRIENAVHVSDANIQEFIQKTDKKTPVIIYCYHGNSSQGAAAYFQDQGFKEVYSMEGGFEHWKQNYPFDRD